MVLTRRAGVAPFSSRPSRTTVLSGGAVVELWCHLSRSDSQGLGIDLTNTCRARLSSACYCCTGAGVPPPPSHQSDTTDEHPTDCTDPSARRHWSCRARLSRQRLAPPARRAVTKKRQEEPSRAITNPPPSSRPPSRLPLAAADQTTAGKKSFLLSGNANAALS
jgi:hypothetical protein